jgi:hypothetical protein
MPDSRIRPRRGFAAGSNGVWGEEPTLYRAPVATLGRSTIYLMIIILFISLLRTLLERMNMKINQFVVMYLDTDEIVHPVAPPDVQLLV